MPPHIIAVAIAIPATIGAVKLIADYLGRVTPTPRRVALERLGIGEGEAARRISGGGNRANADRLGDANSDARTRHAEAK